MMIAIAVLLLLIGGAVAYGVVTARGRDATDQQRGSAADEDWFFNE
jgi:hypothetical protein